MPNELDKEQNDRIQAFVATYNVVDKELKRRLNRSSRDGFVEMLRDARFVIGTSDFEFLNTAAQLRNFLVHEPKRPYDYVAVPTPAMVERMKQIAERLVHPERVTPRFQRHVETVAPDETLASVLERIAKSNFSQFPVYSDKSFKGLLTENGITRWLAHQVSKESIFETKEVLVRDVVREEEKRQDCAFVARDESVDSIRKRFSENNLLEAVLITQTGVRNQQPLGIITRWDNLEAPSPNH